MNSKKSIVALAGGAALLAGALIAASAASASESEPKIAVEHAGSSTIASQEAFVVPSAAELEGYANCMTEAGFEVSVFEGGILGAVVDASKAGWDSANLKCAEENFDK